LHLEAGDREVLARVAWLAYDDLHAATIRYLRCEYLGQTLQATGHAHNFTWFYTRGTVNGQTGPLT
jgi:hypothetical protein